MNYHVVEGKAVLNRHKITKSDMIPGQAKSVKYYGHTESCADYGLTIGRGVDLGENHFCRNGEMEKKPV